MKNVGTRSYYSNISYAGYIKPCVKFIIGQGHTTFFIDLSKMAIQMKNGEMTATMNLYFVQGPENLMYEHRVDEIFE